jgi:hypothetical protein
MVSGTAADVRACSTHRKLESSSTWAQWNESKNGESWSGEYVCLKLVQLRNPIGELVSMRPTVVVETHMSGGAVLEGYTTNRLRKQVFATPSEAATKGCEAAIAQVEALGTEPR